MFARSAQQNLGRKFSVVDSSTAKAKGGLSMLGEGCSFEGKMFLQGETRIGGNVEGTVVSAGILVIEESARIKGEVRGARIHVSGTIEGNVFSSELLCLSPQAKILGNINAARLTVENGAVINGKVEACQPASEAQPTESFLDVN